MAIAAVPGVAVMFWLNAQLYGSAIASGYGDATQLFSTAHIQDNLTHFGRALLQTQYLVPLLGVIAPVIFAGDKRRLSAVLLIAAGVVIGIYLVYQPFPEWWYLRFLIPALVLLLLILTSAVAVELATRARMGGVIPIVAVVIAILGARAAGDRQAFELQRMEGRYRDTAALITNRLPANAVLITVWQSGSVRFQAGREAVLWDSLDPAWLDRAVAWLTERGLQPYFLLERREEPEFRARSAANRRWARSTGRRASTSIGKYGFTTQPIERGSSPAKNIRPTISRAESNPRRRCRAHRRCLRR